jgi:hypothetical protein
MYFEFLAIFLGTCLLRVSDVIVVFTFIKHKGFTQRVIALL